MRLAFLALEQLFLVLMNYSYFLGLKINSAFLYLNELFIFRYKYRNLCMIIPVSEQKKRV